MTSNINYGNQIYQPGSHNSASMSTGQSATDLAAALRELLDAVEGMQSQVPAADRQRVHASVSTVRRGEQAERGAFREALSTIAGVAAMVGGVGVPVVEAVRKVAGLLVG
jgi:hypothetical protein